MDTYEGHMVIDGNKKPKNLFLYCLGSALLGAGLGILFSGLMLLIKYLYVK